MELLYNRFFYFFHVNRYLSVEERQAVVNACDYDDERFWSKIEEICKSRIPLVRIAVIYTLYRERKLPKNCIFLSSFIERLPADFRKNNPWYVYAILAMEYMVYNEPDCRRHVVIDGDPKIPELLPSIKSHDKGVYKLGFMISTLENAWIKLGEPTECEDYLLTVRKIFFTTLSKFGIDLNMEFSDMERILMFHLFYWIWLQAVSYITSNKYLRRKDVKHIKIDDELVSYWYNLALKFADDVDMDLVNLHSSCKMLFALHREKETRFCEMEFQYYKFEMVAKEILRRTKNDEFFNIDAEIALKQMCNILSYGLEYKLCDGDETMSIGNTAKEVSLEKGYLWISAHCWERIVNDFGRALRTGYKKKRCECRLNKKLDEFSQELTAVKHSVFNAKQVEKRWKKNLNETVDSIKQELNGVKSSVSNAESVEDKHYKDLKEMIDSIKQELNGVKSSMSNAESDEDRGHTKKDEDKKDCGDLKEAFDSFKEELTEVKNQLPLLSNMNTAQRNPLQNTEIHQIEDNVTAEEPDDSTETGSFLEKNRKKVYLQHKLELFVFPTSRYLTSQSRKEVDKCCESGDSSLCLQYLKHLEQQNESLPVRFAVFCRMFNQMDLTIARELTKQYLDTLGKEFCVKNPSYICALNLLAQDTLSSEGCSENASAFHCWIDKIAKISNKISDEEFFVMDINDYFRKVHQQVFECFNERGVHLKRSIYELDEIERVIAFSVLFYMWCAAVSRTCSNEVESDATLTEMCVHWNTICLVFANSVDVNLFELLSCCLMFELLLKEKVPRNDKMKLCYSRFKMAADVFLRRVEDGEFAKREINKGLTVIEKLVDVGLGLELCKGNEAMELLKRAHYVATLTLPPSSDIGGKLARLMRATFKSMI